MMVEVKINLLFIRNQQNVCVCLLVCCCFFVCFIWKFVAKHSPRTLTLYHSYVASSDLFVSGAIASLVNCIMLACI